MSQSTKFVELQDFEHHIPSVHRSAATNSSNDISIVVSIFDTIRTLLQLENLEAMLLRGPVASRQLGQMLAALLFFHISEFTLAVLIHGPSRVNRTSFLISKPYVFAMICGLIEYAIEITFVPELKMQWWLSNIGLIMVVTGELVRKTGILTARRSFTHDIKLYIRDDHELVTSGIYRVLGGKGTHAYMVLSGTNGCLMDNTESGVVPGYTWEANNIFIRKMFAFWISCPRKGLGGCLERHSIV